MSPAKRKKKRRTPQAVLPPDSRQRLNSGVRDRMFEAWAQMEIRMKRRVPTTEFGERVLARAQSIADARAKQEGTRPEKKPALQEPAIRKWRVYGVISRDPDIALAVALELGVHPGWLYWGLPPKELPY